MPKRHICKYFASQISSGHSVVVTWLQFEVDGRSLRGSEVISDSQSFCRKLGVLRSLRSSPSLIHYQESAMTKPMSSPRQVASRSPHALAQRPLARMVSALLLSGAISAAAQAFPPNINLSSLSGADGFRLDGVAASDYSGRSVSAAGDINGDGIDDLIVGAYRASPNGNASSGSSYVVFGKDTATVGNFTPTLALSSLNGSNGFRLDGGAAGDYSGHSVSAAGDINGDGFGDLIVGADRADPNGNYSGSSYVVFGQSTG
ncbi:MAG: hypothetical protein COS34_10295, partial [Lysobacterales bacterium CG02_land_8_20_14_3_00_62_12]